MYDPYFGLNECTYRGNIPIVNNNNNEEIITLNQAIELIRKSVGNEREDEVFYDMLISQAPTDKEKEIIISIRDDERKHNQILRELYYNFTGQVIPPDASQVNELENINYKDALDDALFGELNAVAKYRKILGTMPSGNTYTLIMSIMTDEIRHACKYNFLICKAN
jgi:rubrerythrin